MSVFKRPLGTALAGKGVNEVFPAPIDPDWEPGTASADPEWEPGNHSS